MTALQAVRMEVFDFMNAFSGRGFLYYKVVRNKLQLEHPDDSRINIPDLETNLDIDRLEYEAGKRVCALCRSINKELNIAQLEALVREWEEVESTTAAWIMGMK